MQKPEPDTKVRRGSFISVSGHIINLDNVSYIENVDSEDGGGMAIHFVGNNTIFVHPDEAFEQYFKEQLFRY